MIQGTKASILCALCGIKFQPDAANICNACTLASMEDQKILQGDQVLYCRFCQRFQRPPWINCERQSKEMLTILLKKIKNINKVNLIDAKFIWTQPHSKRMKIKVTSERQLSKDMKIQQSEVVEFVEVYTQCPQCKKKFTPHDWNTVVQVRQHIQNKRTINNLQQLIITRNLNEKMIKVSQEDTGINLFFKNLHDAHKVVDVIKSNYPISFKISKQLISQNLRDNTSNVKTTISVILPKICRDDLVRIPRKLSKQLGSCCQLLLCTKITGNLHFLDIINYRKIQITPSQYFLYESFISIYPLKIYGKQYQILDCEKSKVVGSPIQSQVWNLVLSRPGQYKEKYSKCHFPEECGNLVIGFEITSQEEWMQVQEVPDIVIVKKPKKERPQKIKKPKKNTKKHEQKQEKPINEKQITNKLQNLQTSQQPASELKQQVEKEKQQSEEYHSIEDDDSYGSDFQGLQKDENNQKWEDFEEKKQKQTK